MTALDWHPNNCLLASGTTGFKVRVFSAYVKDIEEKPSATPWGNKMPFQHLMAEFSNSLHGGGWVHSVSFSSDGNRLAWVGHDSSLSVADATRGMAIYKLKTAYLPLLVGYILELEIRPFCGKSSTVWAMQSPVKWLVLGCVFWLLMIAGVISRNLALTI